MPFAVILKFIINYSLHFLKCTNFRDINEGEEVTVHYGPEYFSQELKCQNMCCHSTTSATTENSSGDNAEPKTHHVMIYNDCQGKLFN